MLVSYAVTVDSFNILLKNLPPEIQRTELVIIFSVHNADLEVTHEHIINHKEITFLMSVPAEELTSFNVIMNISAYKYHPTGVKILIGKVPINIASSVHLAVLSLGDPIFISGKYVLRNPGRVNGAKLRTSIELIIIDEVRLGLQEGQLLRPFTDGENSTGSSSNSSTTDQGTSTGKKVVRAYYCL